MEHRMSSAYILTMVICVHIISLDLLAICAAIRYALPLLEVSD